MKRPLEIIYANPDKLQYSYRQHQWNCWRPPIATEKTRKTKELFPKLTFMRCRCASRSCSARYWSTRWSTTPLDQTPSVWPRRSTKSNGNLTSCTPSIQTTRDPLAPAPSTPWDRVGHRHPHRRLPLPPRSLAVTLA